MSDVLRSENEDPNVNILNPALDAGILKALNGQMANILLELWSLDFESIGMVDGRPLTQELNELIRAHGLDDCTPKRIYHSSFDYILSLLDLQSTYLEQQRNIVYSSKDCRSKYVCRYLMKAIALNFISRDDHGPFKLFSDDLCPGNVLVNDALEIVGVIDWEFCYAALSQFGASIPWWLVLQQPHSITDELGPGPFFDSFLPKTEIFLECMEAREEERGLTESSQRLSALMRRFIQDKSAWFKLTCHMAGSVDILYWDLLDEYCWGPRSSMAQRVHSITATPEIHKGLEKFVRVKIGQLRKRHSNRIGLWLGCRAIRQLVSSPRGHHGSSAIGRYAAHWSGNPP
ncbi:hypothetical protein BJX70DRAFT_387809 [Aspergillus crustosus]